MKDSVLAAIDRHINEHLDDYLADLRLLCQLPSVADTAWDVYDRPAVIHPTSGGSGPMHAFVRHLVLPVANVGISYPDSGAHAPDEHVRIEDLARGIRQTARVFLRMAETSGA